MRAWAWPMWRMTCLAPPNQVRPAAESLLFHGRNFHKSSLVFPAVMRIASISKPLAAVGLLKLYQEGKVDLDAPIQTYVPQFPRKQFEGKEVEVTVRMLLSHLAGIRHYRSKGTLDR